jgi:hypothetical protein
MKIAKLEIKMILALFLSSYEYTLVGGSGMPLKQPLQPDRNDIHQVSQSFMFNCLVRTKVDVVETSNRYLNFFSSHGRTPISTICQINTYPMKSSGKINTVRDITVRQTSTACHRVLIFP